jgi:hypothetical protein
LRDFPFLQDFAECLGGEVHQRQKVFVSFHVFQW